MKRSLSIRLFLTIWVVYLVHFNSQHTGSNRYVYLTMALAEHGSINLDALKILYPADLFTYQDHLYCNNNPGLAFLAAPLWWVCSHLLLLIPQSSNLRQEVFHYFLAHFVCFATTTAVFSAATAILIGQFVYRRTQSNYRAVLASFLYAFGSIIFHFSTHLNQNCVIAFICFAIFLLIFDPELLHVKSQARQILLIGFLIGCGLFIDLSIIPFLVALMWPIFRLAKNLKGVLLLAAGAAPLTLSLMLYLFIAFGNPLLPPQSYYPVEGQTGVIALLNVAGLHNLLDSLVLPGHGIFVYMPYSLLAIWYLIRFYRDEELLSKSAKTWITAVFLIHLIYVTVSLGTQFSQFGTRYLITVIPFIPLLFGIYFQRAHWQLGTILVGISFYINLAGAQLGYGTSNVFQYMALFIIRGSWLPFLDWVQSDEVRSAGITFPGVISPFGFLGLLIFLMTILWLPYFFQRLRYRIN